MTEPRVWDRHDILAEVKRQKMSLTGIARAAGLYDCACRQGLAGGSRPGAQALADALKIPFAVLFPNYGGQKSRDNHSLNPAGGKRQKGPHPVDGKRAA